MRTRDSLSALLLVVSLAGIARAQQRSDGATLEGGRLTLDAKEPAELRGADGRWTLSWAGGELTLEPAQVLGLRELCSSAPLVVTGSLRTDAPLRLEAPWLLIDGRLSAPALTACAEGAIDVSARAGDLAVDRGGALSLRADLLSLVGPLAAPGGAVSLEARAVLHAGRIDAPGGRVEVSCDRYIGTAAAEVAVSLPGGRAGTIDVVASTRLFSSGRYEATGVHGGRVRLSGVDTRLVVATVDASGDLRGGSVCVGTRAGGVSPGAAQGWHAAEVLATRGSRLRADGSCGAGGTVVVGASRRTDFAGSVATRGLLGRGGGVELSGSGTLRYAGEIDARGASGAGRVLFDPQDLILDDAAGVQAQFALIDPNPDGNVFGEELFPVGTDNVVICDSLDDFANPNAGAVYLFDGARGALLSAITGRQISEQIGAGGVTRLTNGNYVIQSPVASGFLGVPLLAGLVTWASGATGVSGQASPANSFFGAAAGGLVGYSVTPLANGNYVVVSPFWNSRRGAATWFDGALPTTGILQATNSVVGSTADDAYDTNVSAPAMEVRALSDGDYVVSMYHWDDGATADVGAARWCDGAAASAGAFSSANSLVGSTTGDRIAISGVVEVGSGNYVVSSPLWAGAGACTWGDGAGGTTGAVSATNSLVGSSAIDFLALRVLVLPNGNYVAHSDVWGGGRGAATWGDGSAGVVGVVGGTNSLVGGSGDRVGVSGVFALTNGNYVVCSQNWSGNRGAVTWCSGAAATAGTVGAGNSLVGSVPTDYVGLGGVVALSDGSYAARSPDWSGEAGAVTHCSGTASTSATVGAANSLIGSTAGDRLGAGGVVSLASGGRYLVVSPSWDDAAANVGAVTWCNGVSGPTGAVSATNSLVGSTLDDAVGSGGARRLSNGHYVVASPSWSSAVADVGAVTWCNGAVGRRGVVGAATSLVGSTAGDAVGTSVTALSNGRYVVCSPSWDVGATSNVGAATFRDGASVAALVVSPSNSLVGAVAGDAVGDGGVVNLGGGLCVVRSSDWGASDESAATLVDSVRGATGAVSAANSLLGTAAGNGAMIVKAVGPGAAVAFQGEERVQVGFLVESSAYAVGVGRSITTTTDRVALLLGAGVDVTLQASQDLVIRSPIVVDNPGGAGGVLTLSAGRRVSIEADVTTDGGDLIVIAGDTLGGGVVDADRGAGDAGIRNTATISAGAGTVTFDARDGAGLTNTGRADYTLGAISAASVVVVPFSDSLTPTAAVRSLTAVTVEGGGLTGATVTVGGVAATVSSGSTSSQVSFTPGVTTPLGSQAVVLTTASGSVSAGSLTIEDTADLAVSKVVDQANPSEGATITYTLTVTNNGAGACDTIALADALPAGLTYVSATPSQGTYASGTGLWSVGTLADGASATLDLECTVDGGTAETTIINNTSGLVGSGLGGSATDDVGFVAITPRLADLAVALAIDDATPLAGGTIVYTLTLTNLGPSDSAAIELTDALPAGVTYVSDIPSQGTYDDGTGLWSVGALASGASATLGLECTVDQAAPGTVITNTTSGLSGDFLGGDTSDDIGSSSLAVATDVVVVALNVLGGNGQTLNVLQPSARPLELEARNSRGDPVAGAGVTFSAPPTGASAQVVRQVLTDANGRVAVVVTANGTPGSYVVTASAGAAFADFGLTNVGLPVTTSGGSSSSSSSSGSGSGCALTLAGDSPRAPGALAGLLLLLATLGACRVRARR